MVRRFLNYGDWNQHQKFFFLRYVLFSNNIKDPVSSSYIVMTRTPHIRFLYIVASTLLKTNSLLSIIHRNIAEEGLSVTLPIYQKNTQLVVTVSSKVECSLIIYECRNDIRER